MLPNFLGVFLEGTSEVLLPLITMNQWYSRKYRGQNVQRLYWRRVCTLKAEFPSAQCWEIQGMFQPLQCRLKLLSVPTMPFTVVCELSCGISCSALALILVMLSNRYVTKMEDTGNLRVSFIVCPWKTKYLSFSAWLNNSEINPRDNKRLTCLQKLETFPFSHTKALMPSAFPQQSLSFHSDKVMTSCLNVNYSFLHFI